MAAKSLIQKALCPACSSTFSLSSLAIIRRAAGNSRRSFSSHSTRSQNGGSSSQGKRLNGLLESSLFRGLTDAGQTSQEVTLPVNSIARRGTVITPHSLHPAPILFTPRPRRPAVMGPSAKRAKFTDPFKYLKLNPRNERLNSDILRPFVTTMGKIKHRGLTGLSWKNQRMVGKAVRRAKAFGITPVFGDGAAGMRGSNYYD